MCALAVVAEKNVDSAACGADEAFRACCGDGTKMTVGADAIHFRNAPPSPGEPEGPPPEPLDRRFDRVPAR
jgi:hypothetical protein